MLRILSHPYLLLMATTLFWSGNSIAAKIAVPHVSPMVVNSLRWLIAVLVLLPFALPHLKRDAARLRHRLVFMLLLGAIGFSGFAGLLYLAVHYTTAINVMIEQSAMPLVVFAGSFLLFGTRVSAWQIAGFLLTLIGVALTAAHGDLATLVALDFNFGDALMMIAVLCYGSYTLLLRLKPEVHWLSTIFVLNVGGLVGSLPLLGWEWQSGAVQMPDAAGLAAVLYMALFASVISQTLYIRGIEAIGPNRAGLFVNLIPIFGALLAIVLLGEELHLYHVAALACILGGIALAERRALKPAPAGAT
ncbi:DMT family transporter [Aurantimonas sp. CSK15Z-1]|nr:DMT family transporter [Aurantimonas sp. CSK15Z-1]MCQ8784250.1 DMT family transporter [Aurantimonas sp. CSK15Z-1]